MVNYIHTELYSVVLLFLLMLSRVVTRRPSCGICAQDRMSSPLRLMSQMSIVLSESVTKCITPPSLNRMWQDTICFNFRCATTTCMECFNITTLFSYNYIFIVPHNTH